MFFEKIPRQQLNHRRVAEFRRQRRIRHIVGLGQRGTYLIVCTKFKLHQQLAQQLAVADCLLAFEGFFDLVLSDHAVVNQHLPKL